MTIYGALCSMKAYPLLLSLHSLLRWLVLTGLIYALYRGIRGWAGRHVFSSLDNKVRHISATLAHVQLAAGYVLYFNSPLTQWFFRSLHIILMTLSIILITIGSAAAKRKTSDPAKFRTMTVWYAVAIMIIFLAIPWPFSPLAQRPLFRIPSL
jgi:hypothetical protein